MSGLRRGFRLLPSLLVLLALLAPLALAAGPSALQTAERARLAGRWREARYAYAALYGAGQREPGLLMGLAEAAAVRGEWSLAEEALRELTRQPLPVPQAVWARQLWAWVRLQQGDITTAKSLLEGLPAGGITALVSGEILLREGDVAGASGLFNLAQPLDGQLQRWRDYRAAQFALLTDPALAERLIVQAAPFPPPQPFISRTPRELEQAAGSLRVAVAEEQDVRVVTVARLWSAEGLLPAAQVLYQQIPPASPVAPIALEELARLRLGQGDSAGALATIGTAIDLFPDAALLWRTRSALAAAVGDMEQASRALDAAERLEGVTAANLAAAAVVATSAGDYDTAVRAYDAAIASAPVSGTYELQAAALYVAVPLRVCTSGRAYARAAFGSAVDSEARRLEAQLALRCGDNATARQLADDLLSADPADPLLLYVRGASALRLGEREQGRADLERLCDLAPASTWRLQAEELLGDP